MDILIVENKDNIISDIKAILQVLGHRMVGLASTGKEAIKLVGDLDPDMILINIKLDGEMSGVEAARVISSYYKIPIIFITAFTKNCLTKSLQLPEDAVTISEPIRKEHLEYCISRVLG
ncbi:response regulator [Methanobacterium sp.]|uniref:response regulator n=1 Tax=Methanobacterium sp. TaxID=2164 RepID=UPI003C7806C2